MKLPPILTGIVLDSVAGTLDFSALGVGFDPRTVLGVLHEPSNRFVFAKGRQGLGYTAISGTVMTLAADVSDLAAGSLTGFADDGALIATDTRLEACRALLATSSATLSNLSTALGTPSDVATGSDGAAGSLVAKVTRLLGTQSGIATVLAAIRDRLPAALVGGRLSVDGSGVVQPVTVGNFPATQLVSGTVSLGSGAAQIGTIGNAFALDATAQAGNTSAAAIAAATGTTADAATASGANTSVIGALRAIRDRLLGTLAVNGTVTSNQGTAGATAWKVDGSGVTQPVSATALPLPSGAATAAAQGSGNASLTSIDSKTPGLGPQTKTASRSTTPASDLANLEPAGTPITGTTMPAGGAGLTGWLSAVWQAVTNLSTRSLTYFEAVNASVAASGFSTYAARTPPSWATRVTANGVSNQGGVLALEGTYDGTTWRSLQTVNIAPGTSYQLTQGGLGHVGYRAYIANGSTAATSVNVSLNFGAN